jgi:hypothetical protein
VRRSAWLDILLFAAAIKVAVGLVGLLIPLPVADGALGNLPPTAISVLNVVAFGGAAALLVFAGRQDLRAVHLGAFFLLVATSFAHPGIRWLVPALSPAFAGAIEVVRAVQVDAFLPYVLWLFVRDFPRVPHSVRLKRMLRLGLSVSWIAGIVLFVANLALAYATIEPAGVAQWVLEKLGREGTANESLYYAVVLTLSALALVVLTMKAPLARTTEGRRVRLFCAALILGWGPVSLQILLESTIPAYYAFLERPAVELAYSLIIYPTLLAIPVGTTYSVLVDHVLGVRLVVRKALRYALARYSVMCLVALPLLWLAWYGYAYRHLTIAEILRSRGPIIVLATGAAVLLLRTRRRLLQAIDRRFFRDQYRAHEALNALVHESQRAGTVLELTQLVRQRIDAALHVDSVALLIRDESGLLVAPDKATRPLALASVLAELLAGSVEPLPVDLHDAHSPFLRLPEAERQWLGDGGFRLLVPMLDANGSLLGVIALGEKKSELPFQSEDRSLLSAVATSCAWMLENRLLRSPSEASSEVAIQSAGEDDRESERALECAECGRLHAPPAATCDHCGGSLRAAAVPLMLAGKFRLDQRIGSGGMGVVYRATDVALGRQVAVKTLPRTSPEHATRLRREARVAASVSHPHLAVIYGAETWHGTPMLVFEFLDGGTLADRIRHAPLTPDQVVALGIALSSALEYAHAAGILHGDIKPSNIGYQGKQGGGTPKLLDFGIARILHGANRTAALHLDATSDGTTATAAPVGTLAYLSPEALQGEPPDTSFDLWSLALVLLEALLGRNPFRGQATLDTVLSIDRAAIADALAAGPPCPAPLRAFFDAALARNPSRRPASAAEFRRTLEHCVFAATS